MRIFVGTLYTVENEFDDCVAAIQAQTYQDFSHIVFEGLRNKEAHEALYSTFLTKADEFDLMIKVDADMVIQDRRLFAGIVHTFETNEPLTHLQIAVHDFFADGLIWGMHAYRNAVRWQTNGEDLFLDRFDTGGVRVKDSEILAPAAIHCKDPSLLQAFHYGVHRGLKSRSIPLKQKQGGPLNYLWRYIRRRFFWRNGSSDSSKTSDGGKVIGLWESVFRAWKRYLRGEDPRLGLAVLGFELALRGRFATEHLDIPDPHMNRLLNNYSSLTPSELRDELIRLRRGNWGWLPSSSRRRVILLGNLLRDEIRSATI